MPPSLSTRATVASAVVPATNPTAAPDATAALMGAGPPALPARKGLVRALRLTSNGLCAVALAIGLLVVFGWVLGIGLLKTVAPGLAPMSPLTAVCFVLIGAAAWLMRDAPGLGTRRRVAGALAVGVLAVAAIKVVSYTSGSHLDIDLLLFGGKVKAENARMSPFSGVIFILLALALLLLDVRVPRAGVPTPPASRPASGEPDRGIWPAQWLTLGAGFCSLLVVSGYAYSFSSLQGMAAFNTMSLHAAFTFLLLSFATLFLRPDRGLMAIATSATPDGVMARRLLPAAVALPLVVGWLRQCGEQRQLYDHAFGAALLVAGCAFVFTTLVWWNLSALHRLDAQRKRVEQGLREAEAVFHSLVETLPQNIYRKDLSGHFTFGNRNFCTALGQAPGRLVGKTDLDFFPEPLAARYRNDDRRVIETGETLDLVEEHVKPDGSKLYVQVMKTPVFGPDGNIIGTQGIFWDVTDRKVAHQELERKNVQLEEAARAERQALQAVRQAHEELKATQLHLVQSEKLAGLGQMVAGVAHEINNPLSFVTNNVVVLQRDVKAVADLLDLYRRAEPAIVERQPELAAQIHDLIDRVDLGYTIDNLTELLTRSREGLKRIHQIVMDLRDFARLDESDLHEVDLNAGIESTVNIILGHAKKKRVTVEKQLAPLPTVPCYPAKINQVIMNLLANAIDASPEGGNVVIRTTSMSGTEGQEGQGAKPPAVRVEVIDQGSGIDPAIRQRIFDPFFTTKPPGKGTGLGLSISYGIVQDHGGTIEVHSEPGKGSTFAMTLPVRAKPQGG